MKNTAWVGGASKPVFPTCKAMADLSLRSQSFAVALAQIG